MWEGLKIVDVRGVKGEEVGVGGVKGAELQ